MTDPVAAIGATANAAASAPTTQTNKNLLDPNAFLQLLVAQLKYQDPSSPVDTASFMNQTAMLTQVQTMTAMQETLNTLVRSQQVQSATDMIGKSVTYTDSAGTQHDGVVTGVSGATSEVTLKIGNIDVPLTSVVAINAAPATA